MKCYCNLRPDVQSELYAEVTRLVTSEIASLRGILMTRNVLR
jgi:hypothetical protein